jgi:hypothetical protein
VKPPSEIKLRMYAIEFERPTGRLGFTVVLLARCPRHALEQALWMFPGLRRACPKCHVHDAAFVDIDWEIGLAFVAKRKRRPPMLLMDVYGPKKRTIGAAGGRSNKEET